MFDTIIYDVINLCAGVSNISIKINIFKERNKKLPTNRKVLGRWRPGMESLLIAMQ